MDVRRLESIVDRIGVLCVRFTQVGVLEMIRKACTQCGYFLTEDLSLYLRGFTHVISGISGAESKMFVEVKDVSAESIYLVHFCPGAFKPSVAYPISKTGKNEEDVIPQLVNFFKRGFK